jgi:hypothetical protein
MTYQPYAWPRTDKASTAAAVRAHKHAKSDARARRRAAAAERMRQQGRVGLQKVKSKGMRPVWAALPVAAILCEALGLWVQWTQLS